MTSTAAVAGTSLLDPAVLARIGNLELVARLVVEGVINGLHRSPHLGTSMDFAEHRPYMPGDDIRRIDWRLYARSDRYYVEEFEADTNTNFVVLLDVSPSMSYGHAAGMSKIGYGCYLAACLAYFSSLQRDRVGLITFDEGITDFVPPAAKHLQVVLHSLDRLANPAPDALHPPRRPRPERRSLSALRTLSEHFRRRSMIIVISDLYDEPADVRDAIAYLRGKGNDLIVFHLLDPAERDFPFLGATNFVDLETGNRMPVVPEYLRDQYRQLVARHIDSLGRTLGEQRIDYTFFDTSQPLDRALFSYLSTRERLRRTR